MSKLLDLAFQLFHFLVVLNKSLLIALVCVWAAGSRAADAERSVIQITTSMQQPVWDAPWRFESVQRAGGTGFVIKGKRIMTNAHVVSWARQILVHRYQDPRPYVAEVEFIGHDCDLAVLTVEDKRFFENLEPLDFGDLPKVRSAVLAYGYPAGGEEISYTRGVVSRIQLEPYAHIGNRQFLSVQTDAAINPGNSGGPVIQDDRVVGVAFQGTPGLENTGFFIPPPVIEHFLKDVADNRYDGFPQAGARVVPLQNSAYRELLKLSDDGVGARVDSLLPIASSEKVLQPEDVLLRIGQYPVASDGTILYQGNRLSAALAFQFAQEGETVPIEVWRSGCKQEVALPVKIYDGDRAGGFQYTGLPRYFVYGGLVFTPLSLDYLRTLGRNAEQSNSDLYYELYYRRAENPDKARSEPIVLASVLADAVNASVTTRGHMMVDKINGVRIDRLDDVVRAFEMPTNNFDVIEFVSHHSFECLDHAEVAKANAGVLKHVRAAQRPPIMNEFCCTPVFSKSNRGWVRCLYVFIMALAASTFLAPARAQEEKLTGWERSVVTIEVSRKQYDYYQPWSKRTRRFQKIGTVIGERQILTTADELFDRTLIRLQKGGRGRWWLGEVTWADYHANLALVTVTDENFWRDLKAVSFGSAGKAEGAYQIVRWREGKLENRRAEFSQFTVRDSQLCPIDMVALEVSSEIQGVGWGEPVIANSKVVGILWAQESRTCMAMPASFIQSVVDARRKGDYHGLGYFHFFWQQSENPASLARLKLPGEPRGVVVIDVPARPDGGAQVLKPLDVILRIDGFDLDIQGDYDDPEFGPLLLENLATRKKWAGDDVKMQIWREGKQLEVTYRLPKFEYTNSIVPAAVFDKEPEYLIVGGLVFQPLTESYLASWGNEWKRRAPFRLNFYRNESPGKERPALVLLSQVLPDGYNIGYQEQKYLVVDKVNGQPVHYLPELREALQKARNGFHVIEFAKGDGLRRMVLAAGDSEHEATARVLKRYGITDGFRFADAKN